MIDIQLALSIHSVLIKKYGGATGMRDRSGVESALQRPYQTFGGVDLYPTPIEKAAAIAESIINNHPFIDGNKRTGYVLMRLILMNHQLDVVATEDEKYDFVIQIASGKLRFEGIVTWLDNKCVRSS